MVERKQEIVTEIVEEKMNETERKISDRCVLASQQGAALEAEKVLSMLKSKVPLIIILQSFEYKKVAQAWQGRGLGC